MKYLIWSLIAVFIAGCNVTTKDLGYIPEPGSEEYQRIEYRKGREAAKADLRAGILVYEDIAGGEEDAWQILWCYRRILKSRSGITYRCEGFTPGPIAYAAGYHSIVRPVIDERLGAGWEKRIYEEAKIFHREHWRKVENEYRQEKWSGR